MLLPPLCGQVDPDNFGEIVQRLMLQVKPSDVPQGSTESLIVSAHDPAYRDNVAHRILDMVIEDTYSHVQDFEWVVSVLLELGSLSELTVGPRISNVLLDLCVRVPDLRPYTVNAVVKVLYLHDDFSKESNAKKVHGDLLYAASWIVGEYNG
jgi:hypothetical protein